MYFVGLGIFAQYHVISLPFILPLSMIVLMNFRNCPKVLYIFFPFYYNLYHTAIQMACDVYLSCSLKLLDLIYVKKTEYKKNTCNSVKLSNVGGLGIFAQYHVISLHFILPLSMIALMNFRNLFESVIFVFPFYR